MKHFHSRLKPLTFICAAIFALVLFLFGWQSSTIVLGRVHAANDYLPVKSSDFTVSEFSQPSTYLQINLNCNKDLPHTADEYLSYGLEVDGKKVSLYNGTGEELNLISIGPGGTSKSLVIMIKIKQGTSTLENAKNLNTIVMPKGAKISSPNPTVYAGIEFTDGLTLVKSDGGWSVQESQSEEETYEVELNATNVGLSWNTQSALPEATIALPFTREANVSYGSTLAVWLNNMLETVTAVQYAGEKQVHLLFENYVAPLDNEMPCIRIQGGDLTDSENNAIVTVTGDISFYEYVDGTWATEKYVQLKETVLGVTTERKLGASDTYAFTLPQTETDKLYAGWSYQGELVQAGKEIEIASYTKRTIETEAVLISYGLIEGASIRYDQTGDCSGIRFGAKLSTEDFSAFEAHIQGVGIIVMPSNLLGTAEFTYENYKEARQAKNFFVSSTDILSEGSCFTLYAAIVKVLQTNYNRAFCARAYLLTENGEYLWTSNIEKRSVYQVATAVMDEHKEKATLQTWQTAILETYLNGVANITYKNGVTEAVSSALSSVITAAEADVNGNFVTLTLTTKKTAFSAITYNGKRVKNASQSYADGILTITFDETKAED